MNTNLINVINVNNLLLNLANGTIQKNRFQNELNNSQGSFAKMLNVILGGDIIVQDSVNEPISGEDMTTLINSTDKDDVSKGQSEIDYSSIINMLFSGFTQNPIYQINTAKVESNNLNSENDINNLNPVKLNGLMEKLINVDSKQHVVNEKVYQALPVIEETVNNLSDVNSNSIKSGIGLRNSLMSNEIDSNIRQDNIFNKTAKSIENLNDQNEMKSVINKTNIPEEILPKEWKENKDDVKPNIEFSSILENKTPIFNENNKIIEISDESTKIKDAVLSQVEDKIIFMAKEKEGTQQVTMELNPKNLGKVNVKMSVEPEKITVEIMALDQKTSSILVSNTQELTKALQNNFNNGNVTVTVTENVLNQYNQSNMSHSQQHSQREQSRNNQVINNTNNADDGNLITEMINLRNFRLNTVV
nr:flagellar hook-length control protein FliK [Sedimentibacter sp.]